MRTPGHCNNRPWFPRQSRYLEPSSTVARDSDSRLPLIGWPPASEKILVAVTTARSDPTAAPATKPGTSAGLIPANVLVSDLAIAIAGFANEVDAVNQYAAPIHAATSHATSVGRRRPRTTITRPNVAITSESHWEGPLRASDDHSTLRIAH